MKMTFSSGKIYYDFSQKNPKLQIFKIPIDVICTLSDNSLVYCVRVMKSGVLYLNPAHVLLNIVLTSTITNLIFKRAT